MARFKGVRGTKDLTPEEIGRWHYLEKKVRTVMARYRYEEIRTPIFESTDLFTRSIGEETDIVQKEMYTFPDRKGRSLTLRPEGTAPVARSWLEHNMGRAKAVAKLFYMGPMFRYERPQKGRFRQFHQFGSETIGPPDAWFDAETISLFYDILDEVGLGPLTVRLGSVGDQECRPKYTGELQEYLRGRKDELCGNCNERLERNPLRVLDCKNRGCGEVIAGAPAFLDKLCGSCEEHLGEVREALLKGGVPFELDPSLVRGLDYYTRTVFEIHHDQLGAQSALGGGGRYDGLMKDLGGPATPGVGFSAGMERIISVAETLEIKWQKTQEMTIYVAPLVAEAGSGIFSLVRRLRKRWNAEGVDKPRNMKNVFKHADRMGADILLLVGEDELARNEITARVMSSGEQHSLPADNWEEQMQSLVNQISESGGAPEEREK